MAIGFPQMNMGFPPGGGIGSIFQQVPQIPNFQAQVNPLGQQTLIPPPAVGGFGVNQPFTGFAGFGGTSALPVGPVTPFTQPVAMWPNPLAGAFSLGIPMGNDTNAIFHALGLNWGVNLEPISQYWNIIPQLQFGGVGNFVGQPQGGIPGFGGGGFGFPQQGFGGGFGIG